MAMAVVNPVNTMSAHRTHKTLDYSYAVSQNLWTLEFPQVNDTDTIEIYYLIQLIR
jgi:hypothetical protein